MRRSGLRFTGVLLSALAVMVAVSFPSLGGQRSGASPTPLNLRVVASPYEPFAFQAEGEARGLDVDLLSLVCSTRGWTFEIEWVSFDDVFGRLRDGTADMAIGAIYTTPERGRDLLLTEPYLHTGLVAITLPTNHLHSLRDMDGLAVGVKRGATGPRTAESLRISKGLNLTIVAFESTEESFGALLSGRVDAVFNDYLNSVHLASTAYSGKLVIAGNTHGPLFLTRDALVFPMRKGLEKERLEFNETLGQLRRGGVLDHVREKWLPYKTPVDLREVIQWSVAGVALASLSVILLIWINRRRVRARVLRDAELRTRDLIDQSPMGILIHRSGTVVYANHACLTMFGLGEPEEMISQSILVLAAPSERERLAGFIAARDSGGSAPAVYESVCLRKSGELFPVQVKVALVQMAGGSSTLLFIEDITARKQAEEALRESEKKLRLILENVDEIVYLVKLDATSLTSSSELISGKVEEILGLTPEDFYAKPTLFFELLHPDDKEQLEEVTTGILRSQKPGTRYYRLFSKLTNDYRWMEDKIVPLLDQQGNITGFQGVARDVTERMRAEEALRSSEVRFRTLMGSANDAIFIAEAQTGRIIDANRRAQELVGRTQDELRTMTQWELHPPEEREAYRAIFKKHVGAGSMFESGLYVQHRDGRRIAVDISANVVEIGGRPVVQGIFRDMTGPRKTEAALRESEARFRTLAETTSAAIMIFQDDRFLYINPAAENMSGYTLKEAQGMSFWTIVHPDHLEMVKERGRARQRGEKLPAHYEIKILTRGGEERWVNLSAGQVLHQGRPAGLVTAFDITERKRAEEDLSRRNLELMSLLASAQAMGGFLDLEAAAKAICQAAITAYGYRMAWIGLVVPEDTEIRVLASAGYDEGYTEKVRVRWDLSDRAQGPCGRAINTRLPVVQRVEDQDFAPWREEAIKRGYGVVCAIPLIHEDTVRGTLTLYSDEVHAFGAQALSGLEIFARQATMAVVNAALYDEARQIIEELGSVNEKLTASRGLIESQLRELQRGRAELAASESRFRQLAETATAAIFIIRDFRYRYVNAFTEMETGYSREELLAMDSWRLIHPDHHELVKSRSFVSRDMEAGPTRHELKIVRKDGEVRWLDVSVSVIEFEGERSIIGTAYDITKRKEAEQSLQESERRYRELTETVSDWIWEVDDQLRYVYCSPRISDLLGFEPSEVLGRRPFDLMPTEEADRLRPVVADLVRDREEFHVLENVNRHKDGSLRILETSAVPTFDPEGRFTGYHGIGRDITERKKIFETLRQSEEAFRRTFDLSPVGAVMVGLDYRFMRCNEAYCRFLGYPEAELAGKTFLDVTHPEDKDKGMEAIRAVARGELGVANFRKRYLRRDGGVVWGELSVRLVPDSRGRPAHFLTIVQDITQRKKAEAALIASEARLKEIVEHSVNLFYAHTSEHVLTYVSPQSKHFLGCDPEEAMVRWTEFVTDNPVNELGFQLTQRAIDTGKRQPPYELELKTKDGRTLWVQVNETPILKDGKTVSIVGAVTDISGLKRAQFAHKETEENIAVFLAGSPLPLISLDTDGRVLEWNHAAEKMTGWTLDEAKGKLCPLLPEARMGILSRFLEEAERNGHAAMVVGECQRRDGSAHSVKVTGASIKGPDGSVSGVLAFLSEEGESG